MERKFQQDLESDQQHIGADYRIEQQRKHACIILRANGRTRKVFASNTPSDKRRAAKNIMGDVKRTLRDMAA
jgi:hypothetical protein